MNFLLSSSRYSALWCPRCATQLWTPKFNSEFVFENSEFGWPTIRNGDFLFQASMSQGWAFSEVQILGTCFIGSHFQSNSPSVRLRKGRFRKCPPQKNHSNMLFIQGWVLNDVCLASLRSTLSLGPLVHCLLWIELIYSKLLESLKWPSISRKLCMKDFTQCFCLGVPSFLYLSCRVKKHLPVRLNDLSVFDVNKVTTCITLLATEALFFCNEHSRSCQGFTPSVHHIFAT